MRRRIVRRIRKSAWVSGVAVLSFVLTVSVLWGRDTETGYRGFFWRVDSESTSVYLFGSIHVGTPELYPLHELIERTFHESDKLAVEADIRPATQMAALPFYVAATMLPADTSLRNELPDDIRALLDDYIRDAAPMYGLAIDRMRPWAAAMMVTMTEIQNAGFKPEWGVDLYFLNQAEKAGKEIIELESVEQQLALFSELSPEVQQYMLKSILQDRSEIAEYAQAMIQSWKTGDAETLHHEFMRQYADYEELAPLKKAMLTDRDAKMTETIQTFLEGQDTVFIVVGAAHLIGEEGIIARLKNNPRLNVVPLKDGTLE